MLQNEINAHEGLMNGMAGTLKLYVERFPDDCPHFESRLLAPLSMDRRQMFLHKNIRAMVVDALHKHQCLLRENCS